jgi:catechol 2,3-dioxygenase-like lactoylglutathione lyase family enzyme
MALHSVLDDYYRCTVSRRIVLKALGLATVGAPLSAFGQGRCLRATGTPGCSAAPVPPVFAPTGWKTVAIDHLTFDVADYRKEAAFYVALMGWKVRSDDGGQAVLDIADWGSVIFRQAPLKEFEVVAARGSRERAPVLAAVKSFCFAIEPWSTKGVEAELRRRGLTPLPENGRQSFESFHVKDPDGFDLQISNGQGLARDRQAHPAQAKLSEALPFEPTGWKPVWLDHISFQVANYKASASFYCNLLGWTPTYDEGSQNQCEIADAGDIIIRGGNPFSPDFAKGGRNGALVDHMSFGIQPWDTDAVRTALEKRGLRARVDTAASGDDIHFAPFKSYHTTTPNGYDLQISDVTRKTREVLPNAVRPKASD